MRAKAASEPTTRTGYVDGIWSVVAYRNPADNAWSFGTYAGGATG